MPQVHESPHSTADPDPVREALNDPQVYELLQCHARNMLRKKSNYSTLSNLAHDAEDIVQQACTLALQKAAEFDPQRQPSVRLWLNGIIFNLVLQCVTRLRKDQARGGDDTTLPELRAKTPESFEEFLRGEDHEVVNRTLEKLRPRDRDLLRWHYFDDRTSVDIASMGGISDSTVRVQLSRARKAFLAHFDPTRVEGQS